MDDVVNVYKLAINNVSRYIRNNAGSDDAITAFQASEVLAIAFCKTKEDAMNDLICASIKDAKLKGAP